MCKDAIALAYSNMVDNLICSMITCSNKLLQGYMDGDKKCIPNKTRDLIDVFKNNLKRKNNYSEDIELVDAFLDKFQSKYMCKMMAKVKSDHLSDEDKKTNKDHMMTMYLLYDRKRILIKYILFNKLLPEYNYRDLVNMCYTLMDCSLEKLKTLSESKNKVLDIFKLECNEFYNRFSFILNNYATLIGGKLECAITVHSSIDAYIEVKTKNLIRDKNINGYSESLVSDQIDVWKKKKELAISIIFGIGVEDPVCIKKYKTKPCEITAVQFTPENYEILEKFCEGHCYNHGVDVNGVHYCLIKTLEGDMRATENDYIIKGLRGEFYPCKPDVFKRKYEEMK